MVSWPTIRFQHQLTDHPQRSPGIRGGGALSPSGQASRSTPSCHRGCASRGACSHLSTHANPLQEPIAQGDRLSRCPHEAAPGRDGSLPQHIWYRWRFFEDFSPTSLQPSLKDSPRKGSPWAGAREEARPSAGPPRQEAVGTLSALKSSGLYQQPRGPQGLPPLPHPPFPLGPLNLIITFLSSVVPCFSSRVRSPGDVRSNGKTENKRGPPGAQGTPCGLGIFFGYKHRKPNTDRFKGKRNDRRREREDVSN